jgi:lipopolysaccharide export system protein LptA
MVEADWLRRNHLRRAAIGLGAVLAFCSAARSQEDEKIVVLNHADSLVGREINGERVRELIGNVKLTQGSVVVTCERALQYLTADSVRLEGEVEVRDSSMRMVCSHGMYYGNDRIAEAFERVTVEDRNTTLTADYGKYFVKQKRVYFKGNVTVEDTQSILRSRELIYDRREQSTDAKGNVTITGRRNRMTIFGNHFQDFKQKGYSRMTEHPRLIQVDTASKGTFDTLTVTSGVMESYQDSLGQVVARDSVRIVRGVLAAEAGTSTFYAQADSIILRRSPFLWYSGEGAQENQVSGDSIFIKLEKRKLGTVYVRGDAYAISRADSLYPARFDQMTGQEIALRFADNKIQQIDVDKTATSLYYLFDGTKPNGLNKASGDHVTIVFANGRIEKLRVIAGPEGEYYPEKMVKRRESEYNLPGFNWRENRARKLAVPN